VSVRRTLSLLAYYGVASRLPESSFPCGELFRRMRLRACRGFVESTGDWVNIEARAFLADGRFLRIGNGSSIGAGSRIYGAYIGDGVMMGPSVTILKDNHMVDENGDVLPGRTVADPPRIRDGAWIGEKAIILPGRTVGLRAIVGAGSVVTRDVPDGAVVGGNPARVLPPSTRAQLPLRRGEDGS
jgi:acetyltransferase-like isoleucine patch superfamily enzyme